MQERWQGAHTDIATHGWIARLPPHPGGPMHCLCGSIVRSAPGCCSFLGSWGLLLAGAGVGRTAYLVALFAVGSVVMRGAGCVVNDMWDRDLDRKVVPHRRPATSVRRARACGRRRSCSAVPAIAAGLLVLLQLPPLVLGAWELARWCLVGIISAGQAGDLVAAIGDGLHLRLRRADGLRRRHAGRHRLGRSRRSTPRPSSGTSASTRSTRTRTARTTRWQASAPPPG